MTAAAKTYGRIIHAGGQDLADTVLEMEIQQAVSFMEEQATAPTHAGHAGPTDGVGGYGEWSGSANRARIIAKHSSKLLAHGSATAMANQGLAAPPSTTAAAAAAASTASTSTTLLVPPAATLLHQLPQPPQSPATSASAAAAAGFIKAPPPPKEKEKILAPHARIAGVLMLIQIATHAPQIYYQHIKLILSRILCPIRDGCRFWVIKGSEEEDLEGWSEAALGAGDSGPDEGEKISPSSPPIFSSLFLSFYLYLSLVFLF